MAAHTVHGGVQIGDRFSGNARQVVLAPGVLYAPDGIGVPAAGGHNLPRRPSTVFVGRDELLAQVAALFAPPSAEGLAGGARGAVGQAITGLGGIGKSELALCYAATRTRPGAVVWWADAETAETLELALADLTYRLQRVATAAGWTTPEAAAWATDWLQAHSGWLLILDNVEDPDLITPLLGRVPAGDILITTRRDIPWHLHGVAPFTLDVLPRPAAIQLLHDTTTGAAVPGEAVFDRGGGLDADAADALAAELGDLPLALQQAGAYIAANRLRLAAYVNRLRGQTSAMLGKTAPGADPRRAVARVFAVTLHTLTQADPAAVDILRGLAWLAPINLPRTVITHPATDEVDQARDVGMVSVDVDDLLGLLASYSLITLTPDTVGIHRLLQATVREHDRVTSGLRPADAGGLTGGQATALAWLVAAVPAEPDRNVAGWGLWRDLLPHLDALFDHLPQEAPDLDLANLLGETSFYLWVQGRHKHALRLDERAVAITEAALGPGHPDTGERLHADTATKRRRRRKRTRLVVRTQGPPPCGLPRRIPSTRLERWRMDEPGGSRVPLRRVSRTAGDGCRGEG